MKHSWIISSYAGSASLPSRKKSSAKTSTATYAISRNTSFTQSNTRLLLPVTGNAFIETIPVDTSEKAGWACTSQADKLLYFDPGNQIVYVDKFTALRGRLPFWMQTYEERDVLNRRYHTYGVLVPLDELAQCAERVLACDD